MDWDQSQDWTDWDSELCLTVLWKAAWMPWDLDSLILFYILIFHCCCSFSDNFLWKKNTVYNTHFPDLLQCLLLTFSNRFFSENLGNRLCILPSFYSLRMLYFCWSGCSVNASVVAEFASTARGVLLSNVYVTVNDKCSFTSRKCG